MTIFNRFLQILPISRKIVFSNFHGRGFGDNPRYIAEEILRQNLPYDLVWLVGSMDEEFPSGIRAVEFYSRRARYELATAGVIVNNIKSRLPFTKKRGQYYIQTWHGDFPLKYIEAEAEDYLPAQYVAESKEESKQTDLLLSGSRFMSNIYRQSFWYEGEILEKGLPRNDILLKSHSAEHHAGYCQVLYAPTFRDGQDSFPVPDLEAVRCRLELLTGKKWIVVVRLHPNDRDKVLPTLYSDNIMDGSYLSDPQSLLLESDLLITDYSSLMYEFGLMNKPVVLFTGDLEEYRKGRGLRSIFDRLPFVRCEENNALLESLPTVLEKDYLTRFTRFRATEIGSFDDGHASEAVVSKIKDHFSRIYLR